jgi:hypothetical protein
MCYQNVIADGTKLCDEIPEAIFCIKNHSERCTSTVLVCRSLCQAGNRSLGPEIGRSEHSVERSHIHHASLSGPQQRKHRLLNRNLTDHIHFELPPQIHDWEDLQRPDDHDPRIIDQTCQTLSFHGMTHRLRRRLDRRPIGDIEDQRA